MKSYIKIYDKLKQINNMNKKPVYQGTNLHNHILLRPDTYIGSDQQIDINEYVINDNGIIVEKKICMVPGFIRIFVEILSNSIDNVWRSQEANVPTKMIQIDIDEESGLTEVCNDGLTIPIEKHEGKMYNPEFIFGTLLSSSNYDDNEERKTSGRNGYGAKLTNIFSTYFKVETYDPNTSLHYTQIWKNNMKDKEEPILLKKKQKHGFTKISWIPDFKRFGLSGYSNDIINLFKRYAYDCAMITKIPVYLNKNKIIMKDLVSYAKLYSSEEPNEIMLLKSNDSEVVILTNEKPKIISFVNGVMTSEGGVHVDAWVEALLRPIVQKFNNAKGKDKQVISIKDVKPYFSIFIVSTLSNPKFTNQSKTKLTSPSIQTEVEQKHINKMLKWSFMESIKNFLKNKEMSSLKKNDSKKGKFQIVEGLDPANKAGGKSSKDCTLILCEGLSAKTYAVLGIQVGYDGKKGRDWFGIYPLKGKILNVRNASYSSISSHKEITGIKYALGLVHGVDYTDDINFSKLKYGKVMLLTDSDEDGYHIAGLIMNFFHTLFPSLLMREIPFIVMMRTPILKISTKNEQLSFYTKVDYHSFIDKHKQYATVKPKYYKGLGTSSDKEVKETFGKNVIYFYFDDLTNVAMDKVFHKDKSDERKQWLLTYNPNNIIANINKGVSYSEFLNMEMIKFSIDDCSRSIPNVIDGLKTSQRKILYSCFSKNLKHDGHSMKVLQLGGFTSGLTNYPHGETSLYGAIKGMAQDFVGSKNIPLLQKDGQFGTRLSGGKDASNERYIFTKLSNLTRYIFRKEDDGILTYLNDEGDTIEPEFYVPIIPMILVNGLTTGIGTGWSSNIPCYNPLDIIDLVEDWITNPRREYKETSNFIFSSLKDIEPWYRGFKGSIEKLSANKYITKGIYNSNNGVMKVTELPIHVWNDNFKDKLDILKEKKIIVDYKTDSTAYNPYFEIITMEENLESFLPLHSYLHISNMVFFNKDLCIKKYNNIHKIIFDFCEVRYDYYIKRKKHLLAIIEIKTKELNNKCKFLDHVINNKLVIYNRDEDELHNEMITLGFEKIKDSFNYLFSMHIQSFTKQKLLKLKGERDDAILEFENLNKTAESQLWLNDLKELKLQYKKWLKDITEEENSLKKDN